MKKLVALSVLLLCFGAFAFADDAITMPQGVGRFYVAPSFTFANGGFDDDGKLRDFSDPLQVFNLGFALEYGILPWITAAVQWVPGWTPWSDAKPAALGALAPAAAELGMTSADILKGDVTTNGVADLFVGAKLQILGDAGPVENDMFRFAVAPGVIIPLPGPDFSKEADKVFGTMPPGTNDEITFASMDRHVFAAGGRFYFDWVINDNFFINLYNETIFYPVAQDLDNDGPTLAVAKNMAALGAIGASQPQLVPSIMAITGEVNYKYQLTFELEPVYKTELADGVSLTAGLPITYRYIPAPDYTLDIPDSIPAGFGLKEGIEAAFADPKDQHSLYVSPSVSVMLMNTPLPLEFKLQYRLPVWGQNVNAGHTVMLQIRAYFAIPALMAN